MIFRNNEAYQIQKYPFNIQYGSPHIYTFYLVKCNDIYINYLLNLTISTCLFIYFFFFRVIKSRVLTGWIKDTLTENQT